MPDLLPSPLLVPAPAALEPATRWDEVPNAFTFSPDDWRKRLEKDLDDRAKRITRFDSYYEGDHNLAFASAKFVSAFGRLFSAFADNWTALVVDAVEERLAVEGFRLGEAPQADKDAWRIWQANDLDAASQLVHTEALICEESYVLVAPPGGAEDPDIATITVEHPAQMIVARSAGRRDWILAGLKRWDDDSGYSMCTLYLPDAIYKWQSRNKSSTIGTIGVRDWVPRDVPGETWPARNPFGEVPIVPFANRPRMLTGGKSEIANVIPVQDAINKLVADMLIASEFASFKQRWVTGMEIPTDPATGQQLEPFDSAVSRLWMSEDPGTKFGEFTESDLGNYVKTVEMLVQHVASQTRTPPHYFYLSGQFPSGESIKSAEAGLVAKTRRKMRHFGEAWEDVIRLAFKAQDDPRGTDATSTEAETIWGDPEYRTEGEHVDAVMKMQALGVPRQKLWQLLGFSPTEIAQFKTMLEELPPPPTQAFAPGTNPIDYTPAPGALPAPMGAPAQGAMPPPVQQP